MLVCETGPPSNVGRITGIRKLRHQSLQPPNLGGNGAHPLLMVCEGAPGNGREAMEEEAAELRRSGGFGIDPHAMCGSHAAHGRDGSNGR
eukprot:12768605-Alexandrium_andersonii.AAC.1